MVENILDQEGQPDNNREILRLKMLDAVLRESNEELAGNLGGFLRKAGDEMNAEYLVRSNTERWTNAFGFHFILHCLTTYAHLLECV